MSIISGPVLSVNSTKILCLPSRNGKRQLTVYSNAVVTALAKQDGPWAKQDSPWAKQDGPWAKQDGPSVNALCLPVPTPHSVKFEHVPNDIFTQCHNSFDIRTPKGAATYGISLTSSKRGMIPIQFHGSYEVILVPSLGDIDRIPPRFTILTREVIEFLNASYPINFGIILCKLKNGAVDYEPFAYSHDIQANTQLFFPTKHYHIHNESQTKEYDDEEVGWSNGFGNSLLGGNMMGLLSRNMPKLVNTRFADDWDHEIYSAGTPVWCHESSKKGMRNTNAINWNQIPADFQLGPSTVLRCKEIVGHSANVDIEMPVAV
jgi:hypothetical protein